MPECLSVVDVIVTVGLRHQPRFCVPERTAFDVGAVVSIRNVVEPEPTLPALSVAR